MTESILYCKNKAVYNIDTQQVYNKGLLPGYMASYPCNTTFKHWLKLRYSSNTNTLARQLKGVIFGQGNRVRINRETHALSLSDCYWIKKSDENILFEQVSPYYLDFWKGIGQYISGTSIPTLYVSGYLRKEWVNATTLCKYGNETLIEKECSRLCKISGIACANVEILQDGSGIAVSNITNTKFMLEQADMSGRIDPDDFDDTDIVKHFGYSGIQMLIVDAIFGNGDRHAGNFGWLRDTDTGEYVKMAPLYDFDHALDSKASSDMLITDAVAIIKAHRDSVNSSLNTIKTIGKNTTNEIFKQRAATMIMKLK